MKKWICNSFECHCGCVVENEVCEMIPCKCVYTSSNTPFWVKVKEPVTESNQLPKLTADVFDREDCPAWANWAAVDKCENAMWYEGEPKVIGSEFWNSKGGQIQEIPGEWDATDWQNSLIERPAKYRNFIEAAADAFAKLNKKELPDWCKVGGYGYAYDSGYFKIIKIIDGGINLKVEWVKDGEQGTVFGFNIKFQKQARLRPYNAAEMRGLVGKVIEFDVFAQLVLMYDGKDNAILAGDGDWISESTLLKDYTIDGHPCGVLEHLEDGEWVE